MARAYLSIVAAIRSVYTRETAGRLVIRLMFAFFWTRSRARNSEETVEKRRLPTPMYLFPREEINERIRALATCPARLRISAFSLSLFLSLFFFSHRRSILLSVLLSISSLSLSQILIYGRVINSRFYSSLCTTTKT